jgi:hypothetical protein
MRAVVLFLLSIFFQKTHGMSDGSILVTNTSLYDIELFLLNEARTSFVRLKSIKAEKNTFLTNKEYRKIQKHGLDLRLYLDNYTTDLIHINQKYFKDRVKNFSIDASFRSVIDKDTLELNLSHIMLLFDQKFFFWGIFPNAYLHEPLFYNGPRMDVKKYKYPEILLRSLCAESASALEVG